MEKKLLRQSDCKYLKFQVNEPLIESKIDDVCYLLEFIGNNVEGKNFYPEGRAYRAIRNETNRLLGVDKTKLSKLRTSKREVQSIRKYFPSGPFKKANVMCIPYKISYIFQAIYNIVSEIRKSKPIPRSLKRVVGFSYRMAFYSLWYTEYITNLPGLKEEHYSDEIGHRINLELQNDFESTESAFSKIFD